MLRASLLNSLERQRSYIAPNAMILETEDEVNSFIDFFIEKTGNKELASILKPIILENSVTYYYAIREEFTAFCDYLEKRGGI